MSQLGKRSAIPPCARWQSSREYHPSSHSVVFIFALFNDAQDQLPRQLLVCAPVGGKCSAGRQKQRWNGVVASDLKKCNLSGTWIEYAQECDSLCTTIQHSVEHLNIEAETMRRVVKMRRSSISSSYSSTLRLLCTATTLAAPSRP